MGGWGCKPCKGFPMDEGARAVCVRRACRLTSIHRSLSSTCALLSLLASASAPCPSLSLSVYPPCLRLRPLVSACYPLVSACYPLVSNSASPADCASPVTLLPPRSCPLFPHLGSRPEPYSTYGALRAPSPPGRFGSRSIWLALPLHSPPRLSLSGALESALSGGRAAAPTRSCSLFPSDPSRSPPDSHSVSGIH